MRWTLPHCSQGELVRAGKGPRGDSWEGWEPRLGLTSLCLGLYGNHSAGGSTERGDERPGRSRCSNGTCRVNAHGGATYIRVPTDTDCEARCGWWIAGPPTLGVR